MNKQEMRVIYADSHIFDRPHFMNCNILVDIRKKNTTCNFIQYRFIQHKAIMFQMYEDYVLSEGHNFVVCVVGG